MSVSPLTREHLRLREITDDHSGWRRWGPYLSERSWGTVREDYSADGDAWDYFPHDLARSKAYRWGEDGIAGICDRYQLLCFALAFWNGRDPILKERLFGLVPVRGQPRRGREGVLLLPRHHADPLLHEVALQVPAARVSRTRSSSRRTAAAAAAGPEFELLDTGIFDDDRYFDIVRRVREGDARGHRHPHRGLQPRARSRRRSTSCRTSGSATPGPGARTPAPSRSSPRELGRPGLRVPRRRRLARADPLPNLPFAYRLGPRHLYAAPGGAPAVHRQRDERAARLRAGAQQPPALRQGRLPPPRRRRRGRRVNPARGRHQGLRSTTAAWCRPAARSRSGSA